MIINKRDIKDILLMLLGAGLALGLDKYLRHSSDIFGFNLGQDDDTNQPDQPVSPKPNPKPTIHNDSKLKHKVQQADKINQFAQSAEQAKMQKNHIVNDGIRNQSLAPTKSRAPVAKYQKHIQDDKNLTHDMKQMITKYSRLDMQTTEYLVTKLGEAYRSSAWRMINQIDAYSTFNQMQMLVYQLNSQHDPVKYTNTLIKAYQKAFPNQTVPPLKKIGQMYVKAVKIRAKQIYSVYHGDLLKQFNRIEHNSEISPKTQNRLLDNFYQAIPKIKQHQKPKLLTDKVTNYHKDTTLPHHDFQDYMSQIDSAFDNETKKADQYRHNYSQRFLNTESHPIKLNNLDNILKSTTQTKHHKHNGDNGNQNHE